MIQIRRYESWDAEAVSDLIRTTMRISNAADYPLERLQPLMDYFSPEKVEQLSRERTCLVADESGVVLGTAGLEGRELVTFFVHPEHQGQGIGTRLLEQSKRSPPRGGSANWKSPRAAPAPVSTSAGAISGMASYGRARPGRRCPCASGSAKCTPPSAAHRQELSFCRSGS